MRLFRHLLGAAIVAAAFAACDLNPQPLPPKDENGDRASGESDGGNFLPTTTPETDAGASDFGSDSGTGNNPTDASPPPQPGTDGGTPDGGDAGDAGDSGPDSD